MRAQGLECLAHRAVAVGTAEEQAGARVLGGADAQLGQVVGVHELVGVVAAPEDRDVAPLLDPVEEDLEDAEATVSEDRARAHDRGVEPARLAGVADRVLRRELRVAVGLARHGVEVLVHGVALRDAEDRARRHVDELADRSADARVDQVLRAALVDAPESVLVLGERHLGDAVVDGVRAFARGAHVGGVADVGARELDVARPVVDVDHIEHPHPDVARAQPLAQQAAEVAGATGDEGQRGVGH